MQLYIDFLSRCVYVAQELREEWNTYDTLLEGIYGWSLPLRDSILASKLTSDDVQVPIFITFQPFFKASHGMFAHPRLASPGSYLYDPALLRRVHAYLDRVLKLLVDVLKRNGCTVIHASYTKA